MGSSNEDLDGVGPTIAVQHKATETTLAQPKAVVIGEPTILTVGTTDVPDGTPVEFLIDGDVVDTEQVVDNAATSVWTAPTPGSYEVHARVAQTATHASSTSTTVTAEIVKSESALTMSVGTPRHIGSAVPLTVDTTGIADGESVDFYVSGARVGSADVASGMATFTGWTPDTAGDYTVQARYGGSSTVAGSNSSNVGVSVTDPIQHTATELTVSPDPVPSQVSTLTANVTDGNDGDTVEFANNGQNVGTGTLKDGAATYEWTPSAGQANQPFSLTARYVGSDGYAPSTSDPVTGTVGLVQTSVSVVDAPATATVGEQVELRATVTGGEAGETIEFRDGDTVLDTVSLPSGGTAIIYWTPNEVREYPVTAHYPGTDTTREAASPSASTIEVQASESTIDLTGPTSAVVGEATTLTADTARIPDGETVNLVVDGTQIDTAQVAGNRATFEWAPSATGAYELRAEYAGSESVGASESNSLVVVVDLAQTQTSDVTVSGDPVTDEPVTLSTTVAGSAEGAEVEFRTAEGALLCTGQLTADGTVQCEWTPEQVGDVAVTAHYLGDETTSPSQSTEATIVAVLQGEVVAPSNLQVTPANPSADQSVSVSGQAPVGSEVSVFTSLGQECTATVDSEGAFSCELGTLPVGANFITALATLNGVASITVTATVEVGVGSSSVILSGPASVQPGESAVYSIETTGIADGQSVNILVDGTVVDTVTVTDGEATYSWTPTEAGTSAIRAEYEGSDSVAPAQSDELTITVDEAATQTSRVNASPEEVSIGDPVVFSATVDHGIEGVEVEFRDGDTVLCTGVLAADGTAECDWTPSQVGPVQVSAHYAGDAATSSSQSPRGTTLAVGKTASGVDLTATSSVEVGGDVQFSVTTSGIADGQTVDITVNGEVVGSPTVSDGQAALTWTAPTTAGTLSAVAEYAGTDTTAASAAEPVLIEVGVASTSTSEVTAASEATVGEAVEFSATVTGGTVGAEVEFRDGDTLLCTGVLAADGTAVCDWTPTETGTINATAHYPGDDATGASDSAEPTTLTVDEAPDTEAPAVPAGISVTPRSATVGETITVSGTAEAESTVAVMVDGEEVCEITATDGVFSCDFVATEELDGKTVTITATDTAGNTSDAADGGTVDVQPEVVDPTEPTITLDPAQPVAGEPVEIEITGDAGEEVVITDGADEICRSTLDVEGSATCEWAPGADGQITLQITVGDQTVEETVTVRAADDDGDGEDDGDGGDGDGGDADSDAGSGSPDMGSLQSIFGGDAGSSGSLGSLGSIGA